MQMSRTSIVNRLTNANNQLQLVLKEVLAILKNINLPEGWRLDWVKSEDKNQIKIEIYKQPQIKIVLSLVDIMNMAEYRIWIEKPLTSGGFQVFELGENEQLALVQHAIDEIERTNNFLKMEKAITFIFANERF